MLGIDISTNISKDVKHLKQYVSITAFIPLVILAIATIIITGFITTVPLLQAYKNHYSEHWQFEPKNRKDYSFGTAVCMKLPINFISLAVSVNTTSAPSA